MVGHSGTFSFKHSGDLKESKKLLSSLKVFTLAESLGGYESLAELPWVWKKLVSSISTIRNDVTSDPEWDQNDKAQLCEPKLKRPINESKFYFLFCTSFHIFWFILDGFIYQFECVIELL